MEQIKLSFPANRALSGKALAGVVGSGDMEVLYTAGQSNTLNVEITTSVDNSQRWSALFERLSLINGLPGGDLVIHDFGATPASRGSALNRYLRRWLMRNDRSFIELRARERARFLLDDGSYRELLDPFEGIMSPWLGAQGIVPQSDDGMVVAKGTINGQPAVVIAIEGTFRGGSMGEVSGAKMAAALELAAEDNRNGIPTQAVLCSWKPAACACRRPTWGLPPSPIFMPRLSTCAVIPRWSALSPVPLAASAGCPSPRRCAVT